MYMYIYICSGARYRHLRQLELLFFSVALIEILSFGCQKLQLIPRFESCGDTFFEFLYVNQLSYEQMLHFYTASVSAMHC